MQIVPLIPIRHVLHLDGAAADTDVALRIGNFNSCRTEMFADQIIQIAFETARPAAHFLAPNDELEIDCAASKFLKERIWRWVTQRGGMLARCINEHFAHFVHVAVVSDAHGNAKTHSPVAISPVCHRRIDEFLVWYDHGDVVVGQNNSAASADFLHLPGDASDFDPITDGNGSFRQNKQAADEIAGDVFQTESHTDAHRAGEYRQRPEMNAGIVQDDNDPDNQHRVADYLRNGVL